jgi:hypothetical protein
LPVRGAGAPSKRMHITLPFLMYVDLQSIAFPGEQVRGELLQAGFVPDHDDVFCVRVGP